MVKMINIVIIISISFGCLQCSKNNEEFQMIKLYKQNIDTFNYWETWEDNGSFTVHWGAVGEKGETINITGNIFSSAKNKVEKIISEKNEAGYKAIPENKIKTLIIEFKVNGMGSEVDLDKRHKLEERLNETLGWTGLGHCDGGSIGSGTMEVCCLVVDFEIAKRVIMNDLIKTEWKNYSRIYEEQ